MLLWNQDKYMNHILTEKIVWLLHNKIYKNIKKMRFTVEFPVLNGREDDLNTLCSSHYNE